MNLRKNSLNYIRVRKLFKLASEFIVKPLWKLKLLTIYELKGVIVSLFLKLLRPFQT